MRWINANKGMALVIAVAIALVAGAVLSRRTGSSDAGTSPATTALPVAASSDTTGASPSTAVPSTTAAQVAMPIDPSGARHVRDESGARQAAVDFASAVRQRAMYLSADAARELLESWTAPGVAASEVTADVNELEQLRASLAAAGGAVWWVVSPLAVKVEAFAADRARVAVWTVTVLASGPAAGVDATVAAPAAYYRTATIDLQWVDGTGWSVWAAAWATGPVPMTAPGDTPATPAEFLGALDGFGLLREHR